MELHFASVVAKIRENINCESRLGKEPAGSRLGSQGPWSMAGAPRCLGSVQDGRSLTLRQTSSGSSCQDNDRSVCDWPTLISLQVPKEPATSGLSGPQVWGRLTSQGRLPLPLLPGFDLLQTVCGLACECHLPCRPHPLPPARDRRENPPSLSSKVTLSSPGDAVFTSATLLLISEVARRKVNLPLHQGKKSIFSMVLGHSRGLMGMASSTLPSPHPYFSTSEKPRGVQDQ